MWEDIDDILPRHYYDIVLHRPLEGVKLSLDCAVADFLSPDQIVISLKGQQAGCTTCLPLL